MLPVTPRRLKTALSLQPFAIIALASATLFVSPPAAANSDVGGSPQAMHRQVKGETVEQRIASLHSSLKITADQETNWSAVAQAMRDNDAAMQKLVTERTSENAQHASAVEDLNMYEKFAQAHVDGLKVLIASFATLYGTMSDSQKATADHVFQQVRNTSKPSVH
jgi:hypothetical protein